MYRFICKYNQKNGSVIALQLVLYHQHIYTIICVQIIRRQLTFLDGRSITSTTIAILVVPTKKARVTLKLFVLPDLLTTLFSCCSYVHTSTQAAAIILNLKYPTRQHHSLSLPIVICKTKQHAHVHDSAIQQMYIHAKLQMIC